MTSTTPCESWGTASRHSPPTPRRWDGQSENTPCRRRTTKREHTDMERALLNVVGASSIALATKSSADITDGDGESILLVLDVTALAGTGTPSLQLILEMLDDVSGKYISMGTFVAVTTVATF